MGGAFSPHLNMVSPSRKFFSAFFLFQLLSTASVFPKGHAHPLIWQLDEMVAPDVGVSCPDYRIIHFSTGPTTNTKIHNY
jgi:hypothetical protein